MMSLDQWCLGRKAETHRLSGTSCQMNDGLGENTEPWQRVNLQCCLVFSCWPLVKARSTLSHFSQAHNFRQAPWHGHLKVNACLSVGSRDFLLGKCDFHFWQSTTSLDQHVILKEKKNLAELNGKAPDTDRLVFPLNKHGLSKRQEKHLEENMLGMKNSDKISTHPQQEQESLLHHWIVRNTLLLKQGEWFKHVCPYRQRCDSLTLTPISQWLLI